MNSLFRVIFAAVLMTGSYSVGGDTSNAATASPAVQKFVQVLI